MSSMCCNSNAVNWKYYGDDECAVCGGDTENDFCDECMPKDYDGSTEMWAETIKNSQGEE